MQAEIDIPNPNGHIISGMYAKAKMQINSRENVLSLPLTAITLYQDLPHAMTVKDDIVVMIPLRKGLSGRDYFEILNSEITAETMVIVQGKGLVKDGDVVRPILKK
jgi:multidrug efflux pump subunit AcrA (membrane-fusion protein)